MTFGEAVRTCFSKYATFSGRATRSEYWWFFLFVLLGNAAAGILDGIVFGWSSAVSETVVTGTEVRTSAEYDAGPIGTLFGLAVLIPNLAVGWRRMHDIGKPGYMLIYPLLIMIGIGVWLGQFGGAGAVNGLILGVSILVLAISPLLVLWWLTRPSQPGSNDYGPNPGGVAA